MARSRDVWLTPSRHTDLVLPVERQHPTHHVVVVELGKPDGLLEG